MRPSSIRPEHIALLIDAQVSSDLVFLSGFHALKHALRFGAHVLCIATTDPEKLSGLADTLAPDLRETLDQSVELVTKTQMKDVHPHRLHWTEVWAVARRRTYDPQRMLDDTGRIAPLVLLEDPRHLGNLGASIRTAAALGASGLIVIGDSDPWSPRAVQCASGLQYALPVSRISRLEKYHGPLVVFDPEGADLSKEKIPSHALLLFGTERLGVGSVTKNQSFQKVRIPMREGVSSLNLAASVSVALSHIVRPSP